MTALNHAAAVYLGSSRVDAVYAGANRVWPVDITPTLTPGVGFNDSAYLDIPAWDRAYSVTLSAESLSYTYSRMVGVRFQRPATPAAHHRVTVTYAVEGIDRRIYHVIPDYPRGAGAPADFLLSDGLLIAPSPTAGDTTTIEYAWDVARQCVTVSEVVNGPAVTRDYGPDESAANAVPLYCSPELKADADYAAKRASHLRALAAIPAETRGQLASVGTIAEVVTNSLRQSVGWRGILSAVFESGISGLTTGVNTVSYSTAVTSPGAGIEAQTMLHELGHALDNSFLHVAGYPTGIDPYIPPPRTDYFYHPGTSDVWFRVDYTYDAVNSYQRVREYAPSGELIEDYTLTVLMPRQGTIRQEADVVNIYATVDPGLGYYASEIDEWVAQCCMLFWATKNTGYSTSTWNSLLTGVGGATPYGQFVDYMESIGAFL